MNIVKIFFIVVCVLLISACAGKKSSVQKEKYSGVLSPKKPLISVSTRTVLVPYTTSQIIVEGERIVDVYKKKLELEKGPLLVDDFNDGTPLNNLGQNSGTFEKDPKDKTQYCESSFDGFYRNGDTGYSMKLSYNVDSPHDVFNGYWTRLPFVDLSIYDRVTIFIKGSETEGFTTQLKLEIKSLQESGSFLIKGITSEWKAFTIPLKAFKDASGMPLGNWKEMTEMVVVFEKEWATVKKGAIYIDDIYFSFGDPKITVNTMTVEQMAKLYGPRTKIPPEGPLWVDSFDDRAKPNDLDLNYGAWSLDPNDFTQYCNYDYSIEANHGKEGSALQLTYDVDSPNPAYNGFWIKLGKLDLTYYDNLVLYVKGTRAEPGFTTQFKLELKNEKGEVGKFLVTDVTKWWKKFEIPLKSFSGLTSLKDMTELVVVFEDRQVDKKEGIVYLDDIQFTCNEYFSSKRNKQLMDGIESLSEENKEELLKHYTRALHFYNRYDHQSALMEIEKSLKVYSRHKSSLELRDEIVKSIKMAKK